MSLIKKGSLFDFTVKVKPQIVQEMSSLGDITTFRELAEITRKSKPISFDLSISPEERGLALKSLTLNNNFDGFLNNFLKSKLYTITCAWDMSDKPINQYPQPGSEINKCSFTLGKDNTVEFPNEGIPLFQKRKVLGGIAFRIFIMESDQEIKNYSSFLSTISDTIRRSELNFLLGLFSKATGVNSASMQLASQAAQKLTNSIGDFLKTNSDDYIDYIEGYYPINNWVRDFDTIENNSSTVVLNRF